jgi:hypothetical protein
MSRVLPLCPPPKRRELRAAATARTKRYRERSHKGIAIAPVPVSCAILDLLLGTHWLEVGESENRQQIGAAIGRMLADTAKNRWRVDIQNA